MNGDRFAAYAVAVYILGIIIAFGHGANRPCDVLIAVPSCSEQAVFNGLGAGLFWPFYISVEVWKP